jgi:hypothetical protein
MFPSWTYAKLEETSTQDREMKEDKVFSDLVDSVQSLEPQALYPKPRTSKCVGLRGGGG